MPKNKAQFYQSLQARRTGCHNSGTAPDKSSDSQILVHTKERNSSQSNENIQVQNKIAKKISNHNQHTIMNMFIKLRPVSLGYIHANNDARK
jgi:hypothetical protein